MKSQSKRKFTYQGQAYDLPDYFDCCLEIYVIEWDPEIFPYYSKPTIRNSLNIQERWCRTSKAEVLGPIHWDLVAEHTDAIRIIYENTRMGKYQIGSEENISIFTAKCPVRFKAGTAIFKIFFNTISEVPSYLCKEGLFLLNFSNEDCATLYKQWFYDSNYESNFGTVPPSLEHVREDCAELTNFCERQIVGPTAKMKKLFSLSKVLPELNSDSIVLSESDLNNLRKLSHRKDNALHYILALLRASTSLKEFFKSAEILKTVDLSVFPPDYSCIEEAEEPDGYQRYENTFEAFDIPPNCECELGTVNYLSLWYQVKKQLFDIIND